MTPGVYDDIPHDAYLAGPGVSVSALKTLAREGGPARLRFGGHQESKALTFGSLIHTAVLEPDALPLRYHPVALTALNPNHKSYQAAEIQAAGREIVRRDDYEEALRIRDGVLHNAVARDMLGAGCRIEQSFYWTDDETGLLCRGRADGVRDDFRVLFDLKSCIDATWIGFAKSIEEYKYYWQDAWYRGGWERAAGWAPDAFIFLAVEKERPYLTAAYEIDPKDMEDGRDETRRQLLRFAACEASGQWPGLPDTLQLITRPARRALQA